MPRLPRMLIRDGDVAYHVVSRTALDGFVLGDVEKEYLMDLIKWLSGVFFVEVYGFCIMGNHFHLLCSMESPEKFSNEAVLERVRRYYQKEAVEVSDEDVEGWRDRFSSLSRYVQEIKQRFSRWYNKRKGRKGYFWGGRFKSVVLERDEALLNCLAYIDLNPVRAGLVSRPEQYRWCSLGYHAGTGNKDRFLSTDFGVEAYAREGYRGRLVLYRRFVYEKGGMTELLEPVSCSDEEGRGRAACLDVFMRRIRYFTDGLIIGSRRFVEDVAWRVRDVVRYNGRKRLKCLSGLGDLYSFRNLG